MFEGKIYTFIAGQIKFPSSDKNESEGNFQDLLSSMLAQRKKTLSNSFNRACYSKERQVQIKTHYVGPSEMAPWVKVPATMSEGLSSILGTALTSDPICIPWHITPPPANTQMYLQNR